MLITRLSHSGTSRAAQTLKEAVGLRSALYAPLLQEKEMEDQDSIRERVRKQYAREAERVLQNSGKASCCGSASSSYEPITSNLYAEDEKAALPTEAVAA